MTADPGPCHGPDCQHVSHPGRRAQIHTDLSIIFGAVVGAMLRAGVTPGEVQLAVTSTLKACKSMADRPGILDALADVAVTAAMDALEDWPGSSPER